MEISGRRPASRSELAYHRIRDKLLAGDYQPGDQLAELHLCDELGMSRTPIREALRRLENDRLVVPGARGVTVAGLRPSEVRDTYQLRAALESLAAELAAGRQRDGDLAPAQLREIRRAAAHVDEYAAAGDSRATTVANLRLHQLIAVLGGNALAEEALGRLWDRITVASRTNLTDPRWLCQVGAQHHAIVDAIHEGDPARAADAARRHVEHAADVYAEWANAHEPETSR